MANCEYCGKPWEGFDGQGDDPYERLFEAVKKLQSSMRQYAPIIDFDLTKAMDEIQASKDTSDGY